MCVVVQYKVIQTSLYELTQKKAFPRRHTASHHPTARVPEYPDTERVHVSGYPCPGTRTCVHTNLPQSLSNRPGTSVSRYPARVSWYGCPDTRVLVGIPTRVSLAPGPGIKKSEGTWLFARDLKMFA